MAILFKTDGSSLEIHPLGSRFSLTELQSMVGGYIEAVRLRDGLWLIVNEEGRLLDLPVNVNASRAANQAIVGNALVVTFKEMEGREEWEPEEE